MSQTPPAKPALATTHNGTVYVSAVQGFVPGIFALVSDEPGEQARQALRNLQEILEGAGSSLNRVLKITVFLTEMSDFPSVNAAVNEAFPQNPPARSSVAVGALSHGARVAIEATAAVS